ncbi:MULTISPECIES: hypothetical protein [Sphingobium]|uniref:Uncharacterized protein n=1 Tax=Sphingobium lignivorans TaxID=2735886 RepID=A0ABR6NIR5_9SPHN|nr:MULTISPECIES: hypothetical protein [Sphingobium]MBB5987169.1 hypothetical protein [Sphingobium lignivorans]BAK67854.1 hypothetical protein SLG_31790 [Sphingobium sp. SYK-6]
MDPLWDRTYLQRQIDKSRELAHAALHPDVKAIYLSYVQHYETLLTTLSKRGAQPAQV